MKRLILAFLLMLTAASIAQTTSLVPGFISYQGKVLNSTGGLVGAGTPVNRTVIFRVWDHPSNTLDANLVYSEQQTVTIAEGEFSVLVGQGTATTISPFGYAESPKGPPALAVSNAFNGANRYLGVTVAAGAAIAVTDNEITPRQQIVSSAFAFRSKFAEMVSSGTDLQLNGSANYGLGYYGGSRLFNGTAIDGPVLYGNAGGALGSFNGTNQTTALRWNANGQVGIGSAAWTTGAATNAKLVLQGDDAGAPPQQLNIRGNSDTNRRLLVGYNTTSNYGSFQSYSAASNASHLLLNPVGGNVGIGTTNPLFKLDVAGDIRASGISAAGINASGTAGYVFNSGGDSDGGLFSPGDGILQFKTDAVERMRINSAGNVGIGTTAPGAKLAVLGSAVTSATSGEADLAVGDVNGNHISFQGGTGTSPLQMIAAYNGNVQSTLFLNYWGGAGIYLTGGNSAARVSVGQTDVSEKFNVAGNAKIYGNLGLGFAGTGALTTTSRLHMNVVGNGTDWDVRLDSEGWQGALRMSPDNYLDMTNRAGAGGTIGGTGFARLNSTGAWTVVSDGRLKCDVEPLQGMLDKAMALRPVNFHYKSDPAGEKQVGFVAQEVEELFPSLVTDGEILTMDYAGMSTVAIGAIKEQQAIITALRKKIEALEKESSALTTRLEQVDQMPDRVLARLQELEAKDKARDAKMASIEKLLESSGQPATRTNSSQAE
jgi:hypothetical protein